MSLTDELREPKGRINMWLRQNAKSLLNVGTSLTFMKTYPLATMPAGTIPALAGTAFDYLFRWTVGPLNPYKLVAHIGGMAVSRPHVVAQIVAIGDSRWEKRPACCVALAQFEQIARGNDPLSWHTLREHAAQRLVDEAHAETVADLAELGAGIGPTFRLKIRAPMIGNPVFAGSTWVGGADGDWILGRTLYDCKVTARRDAMKSEYVTQLGVYALLDWHDEYKLDSVAVYLPRQRVIETIPLVKMFPDLAGSRKEFKQFLMRG